MKVVYMAHPVSGDVAGNLERAKKWVRWIEENHDGVAVVASWIIECEVWDDDDPQHREAGLRRDLAVLERCDELWLVGPHISEGMQKEREHAEMMRIPVRDLTDWHVGKSVLTDPAFRCSFCNSCGACILCGNCVCKPAVRERPVVRRELLADPDESELWSEDL